MIDAKLVTAAVKIRLSMLRRKEGLKLRKLEADLARLVRKMSMEEYNEYVRRIA